MHRSPRSRSALVAVAAVVALATAAGCSSGDATQGGVQDDVEELLREDGYGGQDLTATQVGAASACIAQALFDPTAFSKDERNEIATSADSDPPPAELVGRFEDLVGDCVGTAIEGETQGPTPTDDGDDAGNDDDPTTTERQASDDEETTTTEG